VEVLRGWDPNEPSTFTQTVRAADTILSGQLISLLGGAAGRIPYIAVQDSSDEDVVECGKLTGLSCAGKFEIETAHYKTGETYGVDTLLTWDGTTGNVKPAAATNDIVGIVTRNRTTKSLNDINSNVPSGTTVISFFTNYQAVDALP
jgi:hypothetical protein